MFKILKTEGKARRGEFSCAHGGTVQTPVFMNVGTQAAIKGGVSALDLKNVGCHQDIAEVAPDAALTAVQIYWEAYYTYALTCLLEGEEIPQDWCGSYADGACGLTALNASAVASGTAQAIQDAAAALEEGSLQVFAGPLHGVAGDGEVLSLGDGDYYTENQDSSIPTFHYIVDGITVLS